MKFVGRWLLILFLVAGGLVYAQTAPTFRYNSGNTSLTLPGRNPAQSGTTVTPTVLVPVRLVFDEAAGRSQQTLDAAHDVPKVLRSPVFQRRTSRRRKQRSTWTLCCAQPRERRANGTRCSASLRSIP
jgi:hypothetical protein